MPDADAPSLTPPNFSASEVTVWRAVLAELGPAADVPQEALDAMSDEDAVVAGRNIALGLLAPVAEVVGRAVHRGVPAYREAEDAARYPEPGT